MGFHASVCFEVTVPCHIFFRRCWWLVVVEASFGSMNYNTSSMWIDGEDSICNNDIELNSKEGHNLEAMYHDHSV